MSSNAGAEVTMDKVKVRWSEYLEKSREMSARAGAKWKCFKGKEREVDLKNMMFGNFYVKELQPILDGTMTPIIVWDEVQIQAELQKTSPNTAWTARAHRGCLTEAQFEIFVLPRAATD